MAKPKLWRESKSAVLQEWDAWSKLNSDDDCSRRFFEYLQTERPDLLNFNYPGDRGMIVQAWLTSTGRLDGQINSTSTDRRLVQLSVGKTGYRPRQHSA